MSRSPSHGTAMLGGGWTALGFVPFDMWLAGAKTAPQHLVGLLWLLMGVIFLWAPIRFVVVGRSITTLFPGQNDDSLLQKSLGEVGLRALTWVLSCTAVGIALSVGLFLLGIEEPSE
jgi:hypothetical protein